MFTPGKDWAPRCHLDGRAALQGPASVLRARGAAPPSALPRPQGGGPQATPGTPVPSEVKELKPPSSFPNLNPRPRDTEPELGTKLRSPQRPKEILWIELRPQWPGQAPAGSRNAAWSG